MLHRCRVARVWKWSFLVAVVALSACAWQTSRRSSGWEGFVKEFLDSYFTARPDVAVDRGRHESDGKLPDWSRNGIDRQIATLRAYRRRAIAFPEGALQQRQKLERDHLVTVIDGELFWLTSVAGPGNPAYYQSSIDPNVYAVREYALLPHRLRAYTVYARALAAAAEQIRANMRLPMPRTWVDLGHVIFGGMAEYLEKDVPGIFAPVGDPALQAEFRAANGDAIQAMRSLDLWFQAQRGAATEDFAMGAEQFEAMLYATERVDLSLEQLEGIGRQDLERNLTMLRETCSQYLPGGTITECVAKVRARKSPEGPVDAARRQLGELKVFLQEQEVVTIPGAEEAVVAESPPYMRWASAYVMIPGPYEKGLSSTYYITPPDPQWSAEDQEDHILSDADLLFTSVHEVWPGHFLQIAHAKRAPSTLGQAFVSYACGEGWAHYTEEMMWEAGLGRGDREKHIAQLRQALLRDVRFLSAIGMHTRGMKVMESERMFRESAFADPATARREAARGTFDPQYLNYTLGKLMIRKLREDWTATRGGRAAWREFHDRFLSFGGPPTPLVRNVMMQGKSGPPV